MRVWCSGRGGTCTAGGLGFESRRLRSHEIHAKNVIDQWALVGGGPLSIKKILFFWVKIPIFFGFFPVSTLPSVGTRQRLCRVPDKRYSAKTPLPTVYLPSVLCRVPLALGKFTESGSDRVLNVDKKITNYTV